MTVITPTATLAALSAAQTDGGFPTMLTVIIALVGIGIGLAIVMIPSRRRKPTDTAAQSSVAANDGDIQGTIDTADAGQGTVAPAAEPVVDTEQVVDTTSDEDLGKA